MNVQVIFIDMKHKNVNLFVDKSITIGRLHYFYNYIKLIKSYSHSLSFQSYT